MARVVRRNERNVPVKDLCKRAELPRAETEEVELVAYVGCVSAGWGLPDASRADGRSRALDNEKTHVFFFFKIQIEYSIK